MNIFGKIPIFTYMCISIRMHLYVHRDTKNKDLKAKRLHVDDDICGRWEPVIFSFSLCLFVFSSFSTNNKH